MHSVFRLAYNTGTLGEKSLSLLNVLLTVMLHKRKDQPLGFEKNDCKIAPPILSSQRALGEPNNGDLKRFQTCKHRDFSLKGAILDMLTVLM